MRRVWVQIHLWLGLTLGTVGILIGVTGSLLVYDHEFERWLMPSRYAITGSEALLGFGEYAERVREATDGKGRALSIRLPAHPGIPVIANARAKNSPQFVRLWLDPPTGKVLDAAPGGGFVGWLHRFHENLTLREYFGREIVGLAGIAMLVSSLSGLYLWWPARGRFREALGPRKGLTLSRNLHYLAGFYGLVFLALLSFTGIWLAYVEGGRAVVSAFSSLSPSPRSIQAPEPRTGRHPIAPDAAVKAAQALHPSARVTGLGFPGGRRGVYRAMLESEAGPASVFVDPESGTVLRNFGPASRSAGDRFLALQRRLHTGDSFGAARFLLFFAGLLPALFVVTGTLLWLRGRRPARREAPALA